MKTITHFPRPRNLIATAVFSALATGFSAVEAADGAHAPTAIVRYGDRDVSTVQDATALNARITTKIIGLEASPPGGTPMEEISLSHQLSTAGFDLATPAGVQAFEQRIRDVADAVCKEIGHQYPQSQPDDKECARDAVRRAMVQARKLEKAAAQKHPG